MDCYKDFETDDSEFLQKNLKPALQILASLTKSNVKRFIECWKSLPICRLDAWPSCSFQGLHRTRDVVFLIWCLSTVPCSVKGKYIWKLMSQQDAVDQHSRASIVVMQKRKDSSFKEERMTLIWLDYLEFNVLTVYWAYLIPHMYRDSNAIEMLKYPEPLFPDQITTKLKWTS